jgi:hypothetical protein
MSNTTFPAQIAKHLREVYFGGNWTTSSLKQHLADVDWQQATTKMHSLNTIATLVHHLNYYVSGVAKVLAGGPLELKDEYSFTHPPISSEEDWQQFLATIWTDAEHFAQLIEQLPDKQLNKVFVDEEYGNYYRNLHGIIEHIHYHLGQVVVIKKLVIEMI